MLYIEIRISIFQCVWSSVGCTCYRGVRPGLCLSSSQGTPWGPCIWQVHPLNCHFIFNTTGGICSITLLFRISVLYLLVKLWCLCSTLHARVTTICTGPGLEFWGYQQWNADHLKPQAIYTKSVWNIFLFKHDSPFNNQFCFFLNQFQQPVIFCGDKELLDPYNFNHRKHMLTCLKLGFIELN